MQEPERAELEYYLETLYRDHDTASRHDREGIQEEINTVYRLLEEN